MKSKAYKLHHQEIKEANQEYTRQLDEDWKDVSTLLNFGKKQQNVTKVDEFDDILT